MSNKNHYPEVISNVDFPQIENQILKYWQENNIFQQFGRRLCQESLGK